MAVPTTEPIRELIVQSFYEGLLLTKTDSGGNYFVRPQEVSRQPILFDECKVHPTYFCTDGDQDFSGKPGGDHDTEFPVLVWCYAKDSHNVSRHRSRIIRDVIKAIHVNRSRSQLVYDTRIRRAVHDQGVFAPLTWIMLEWMAKYRCKESEV